MKEEFIVLGGTTDPNSFGPAFYLYRRLHNDGTSTNVVFDCGAEFDEKKNPRGGNFDYLQENKIVIDAVVLSHGHFDHVGAVAKLRPHLAPHANVWATPQTHTIFHDLCWDSLRFSQFFSHIDAIDVAGTRRRKELTLGENEIFPGVRIFAGPNGHVPGSAFFILRLLSGKRALFMNDVALHDQPVVRGAQFLSEWLPAEWMPDMILTTDLTYGNAERKKWDEELSRFATWIFTVLDRGGKVLIPAFRFGRTQNIALELARFGFEVCVDGGGRHTFLNFKQTTWSDHDRNDFSFRNITFVGGAGIQEALKNEALADSREIFAELAQGTVSRRDLISSTKPAIIVTTAGMGDGGWFGYYADTILPNPVHGIAKVGFCAPGTTMDKIMKTKKAGSGIVRVIVSPRTDELGDPRDTVEREVRCDVADFSFTAHADINDSVGYIADIVKARSGKKLERIVLAHGSRASKGRARAHFVPFVERASDLVSGETNTIVTL